MFGSISFFTLSTVFLDTWGFKNSTLLVTGMVYVVLCVLGDLFESWIKRKFEAKDSGDLFPGHGGMMDRTDSFIFSSVFISLLLYSVNYFKN